jgi:spore coat polysaccharide biosynthesis protein SpsF
MRVLPLRPAANRLTVGPMIAAILQGRMSSSRLPGKVLAPVLGRPMIARQLERLAGSQRIDRLILATSVEPSDDPLAKAVADLGVQVVRGPLDDVLGRFLMALDTLPRADVVLRLTADCPLADWRIIDQLIGRLEDTGADYANMAMPRTYPHGLDAEAMRPAALRRAGREAATAHDREHVTPYLYATPGRFQTACLTRDPPLDHLRWTVDYPEDLEFVRHVYETLYAANADFALEDVAALEWNTSRHA